LARVFVGASAAANLCSAFYGTPQRAALAAAGWMERADPAAHRNPAASSG